MVAVLVDSSLWVHQLRKGGDLVKRIANVPFPGVFSGGRATKAPCFDAALNQHLQPMAAVRS